MMLGGIRISSSSLGMREQGGIGTVSGSGIEERWFEVDHGGCINDLPVRGFPYHTELTHISSSCTPRLFYLILIIHANWGS
jgi:hypothetical protein